MGLIAINTCEAVCKAAGEQDNLRSLLTRQTSNPDRIVSLTATADRCACRKLLRTAAHKHENDDINFQDREDHSAGCPFDPLFY